MCTTIDVISTAAADGEKKEKRSRRKKELKLHIP
jgi:hypothetical protein